MDNSDYNFNGVSEINELEPIYVEVHKKEKSFRRKNNMFPFFVCSFIVLLVFIICVGMIGRVEVVCTLNEVNEFGKFEYITKYKFGSRSVSYVDTDFIADYYEDTEKDGLIQAVDFLKDSSNRFSFFTINSDVKDKKVHVNYSLDIERASEVYPYLLNLEKIEGLTYNSSKEDVLKAYKDRGYVCIEK